MRTCVRSTASRPAFSDRNVVLQLRALNNPRWADLERMLGRKPKSAPPPRSAASAWGPGTRLGSGSASGAGSGSGSGSAVVSLGSMAGKGGKADLISSAGKRKRCALLSRLVPVLCLLCLAASCIRRADRCSFLRWFAARTAASWAEQPRRRAHEAPSLRTS